MTTEADRNFEYLFKQNILMMTILVAILEKNNYTVTEEKALFLKREIQGLKNEFYLDKRKDTR